MANEETANINPTIDESSVKIFVLPHVLTLAEPIKWGEEIRKTLTINRRLKAKDFKGIKASDIRFDDMMKLISKVSGEPIAFIEELDASDLLNASEVVQSFLPSGLATGDSR